MKVADGGYTLTDDLWCDAHGEAVDEVGIERGRDDAAALIRSVPMLGAGGRRQIVRSATSCAFGRANDLATAAWIARARACGADGVVATMVRAVRSVKTFDEIGMRSVLSTITRIGELPGARRTVRRGSSAITVPIPTMTASCEARSSCARRSEDSPLTQCASPFRAAIRPSIVCA